MDAEETVPLLYSSPGHNLLRHPVSGSEPVATHHPSRKRARSHPLVLSIPLVDLPGSRRGPWRWICVLPGIQN